MPTLKKPFNSEAYLEGDELPAGLAASSETDAYRDERVSPKADSFTSPANKVAPLPELPPIPNLIDPFEVTIKSDKGTFQRSIRTMHDVELLMTYLQVQTRPELTPLRRG